MAERDMEESFEDPNTAVKSVWNTADSSMGSAKLGLSPELFCQ